MATILVIDDDAAARRVMVRILTDAGHQTLEAENGLHGLRQYKALTPDLVITDLIMPVQEGIQTIAEINASPRRAPIIAVSGGGAGDAGLYLSMAEELGADAVLGKPFRSSDLLDLVARLLAPAQGRHAASS